MLLQEWNDELAEAAQTYVQQCNFVPNPNRNTASFSNIGETRAFAMGVADPDTALDQLVENNIFGDRTNYDITQVIPICLILGGCQLFRQVATCTRFL